MADGAARPKDLYAVLGVLRSAPRDDVKRAYRRLATELHPDVRPPSAEADERFAVATYAYQILGNPERRKLYDEFGHLGLREGFEPESYRRWQRRAHEAGYEGALEDLFRGGPDAAFDVALEEMFGGDVEGFLQDLERRAQRPATRRGREVAAQVRVGFLDSLRGIERELQPGNGRAGGPKAVRVHIPPGVRDGEQLRLTGRGGHHAVKLTVRVEPHPVFRREGEDLHLDLPVTVAEAYRGAQVSISTPSGSVSLAIPAGSPGGAVLRVRNHGVRRGDAQGDLFAHLRVVLPPPGSPDVAAALDSVARAYPGDVRSAIHV